MDNSINNSVRVGRVEPISSTGKYECGFCHRKFDDPTQYMRHERTCFVNNQAEIEKRKADEQRAKEEQRKSLAKADEERIQKEYTEFIKDTKHHYDTYGEPVRIDGQYYGRDLDNMPFRSDILDPLFNPIFMI